MGPRCSRAGPKGRFLINGEPPRTALDRTEGSLRVDLMPAGARHIRIPDEGSVRLRLLDTIEKIRQLPLPQDPLLGSRPSTSADRGRRGPQCDPPAASVSCSSVP